MENNNMQAVLNFLRSNVADDENVQRELRVIADMLEAAGVESASELQKKLAPAKKATARKSDGTKRDDSAQDAAAANVARYVDEAVRLRDKASYELADETIDAIMEVAKTVKKAHKTEGLKAFMGALGISTVGVKSGAWLDKIRCYYDDLALMRFKAVQMREMA